MNTKLTPEMRAFFVEAGSKSRGNRNKGAVRQESARKAGLARQARAKAERRAKGELVDLAREIGGFLDGLDHLSGENEDRRKDLSDRLYNLLNVIKGHV